MPYFKAGDKVILDNDILKGSQHIRIHPASRLTFPPILKKGSEGEVVEFDGREFFVKFMLRKPGQWEQPYLRDNVVHLTLPLSAAHMLRKV